MSVDLSRLEEVLAEVAEEAIKTAAEEYDFDSAIETAVDGYDFDRAIESAAENYDFDSAINNAVSDTDFSEYAREAIQAEVESQHFAEAIEGSGAFGELQVALMSAENRIQELENRLNAPSRVKKALAYLQALPGRVVAYAKRKIGR